MLTLQIISAVLLLLNKWFLARSPKTLGWICGIVGVIILTIYLYIQMIFGHKANLWIMIINNLALIPLMFYGFMVVVAKEKSHLKSFLEKWNIAFKIIVISITLSVCLFLLIELISAELVIIQFIFTISSLSGTLLLAFNEKVSNMFGWGSYLITHSLSAYTMFQISALIFGISQILSCAFALYGIYQEIKK